MSKRMSQDALTQLEKFWPRLSEAMTIWFPETGSSLREWARVLNETVDNLRNWRKGICRPSGKVQQLARMFEPLRSRGGDPLALAVHVYDGIGEMPRPGGAFVPDVSPKVEPSQPTEQAAFKVMKGGALELELFRICGQVHDAFDRGETARASDLLDSLIRLGTEAKKLGLALFILFFVIFTGQSAKAASLPTTDLQSVALPLGYAAVFARILRKLAAAGKAARAFRALPLPEAAVA